MGSGLKFLGAVILEKKLRIFWGILLLLSIGWMIFGFVSTSEIISADTANGLLDAAATQLESLASDLGMETGTFFLVTGLPLSIICVFFIWRNSIKNKKPNIRRQTLMITLLTFMAVFALWNIRELEMLVYPLRLFVTYIHEASHALAALITGGQVESFEVFANGSGIAKTIGGSRDLILPAGYLGAALFGSLLFFLSNSIPRRARGLAVAVGVFLILFTALYARPDQTNSLTAFSIGIGFGLIMVVMGWKAPPFVNQFVLSTLAMTTALHAVLDIWWLVGNADAGFGNVLNDAAAFANQFTPGLPAEAVAFIWAIAAVAMLGAAIYLGAIKPLTQEITGVVKGELE